MSFLTANTLPINNGNDDVVPGFPPAPDSITEEIEMGWYDYVSATYLSRADQNPPDDYVARFIALQQAGGAWTNPHEQRPPDESVSPSHPPPQKTTEEEDQVVPELTTHRPPNDPATIALQEAAQAAYDRAFGNRQERI